MTDDACFFIAKGAHSKPADGLCIMELAAFLAGEPHSDSPKCVSRSIAGFLRRHNDRLNDEDRQDLCPLVILAMGTNTGLEDERKRAWMAADWAVRVVTPIWLRAAKLDSHAAEIAALPELVDKATADTARARLKVARGATATAAAAAAAAADAAAAAYLRKALRTMSVELQRSAYELVERMCAVGRTEITPMRTMDDARTLLAGKAV
jgi:hypothetical protein